MELISIGYRVSRGPVSAAVVRNNGYTDLSHLRITPEVIANNYQSVGRYDAMLFGVRVLYLATSRRTTPINFGGLIFVGSNFLVDNLDALVFLSSP